MMEMAAIDNRLTVLEEWIERAAESLIKYFRPDHGVFWRDNLAMEEESREMEKKRDSSTGTDYKLSPTSTARSFFALFEYSRFQYEQQLQPDLVRTTNILYAVADKYFSQIPTNIGLFTKSKTNGTNPFTDSHILTALCCITPLGRLLGKSKKISINGLDSTCSTLANNIREDIKQDAGAKPSKEDETHDFLTSHAIRGLDLYGDAHPEEKISIELEMKIQQRVKQQVLSQLAFNFADVNSKFDAAELVFSIELLNRFRTEDTDQLTRRALLSIAAAQKDGAWPTGRLVSYQKETVFHIASFEIALTLCNMLLTRIAHDDQETCEILIQILDRSFSLVKSSFDIGKKFQGWCNDHARKKDLFESWTTAIVLNFLIHYHDANLQLRQNLTIRKYHPVKSPTRRISFHDMIPVLRNPDWIKDFTAATDPTDENELSNAIQARLLDPIKNDFVHRPRESSSLILYGKPGTGKTSLVKSLAKALKWPMITISPPNFLRHGFEGFEATAAAVFDDLMHLRRAIVLFDECEDFFRKRSKDQKIESRTLGAFITSGMLPRLQDLRDNNWVIFVLATNSVLKDLDPAVIRPGRFDFSFEVPFPGSEAAIRFAKQYIQRLNLEESSQTQWTAKAEKVLSEYYKTKRRPDISFAILKSFVKEVTKRPSKTSIKALLDVLAQLKKGPQSLIGPQESV